MRTTDAGMTPVDPRTLYVSDLDGTLLNREQALSQYTVEVINRLVDAGMVFSYATARSLITAAKVTRGLTAKIPVIVYNGAFLLDSSSGKLLRGNFFGAGEAAEIRRELTAHDIWPIVYSLQGGREKFSYRPQRVNAGMRNFLETRRGDVRETVVSGEEDLYAGQIFYFTCIDREEKLSPVYRRFQDKYNCVFQRDIYTGDPWLELMPALATKAHAVSQLKELCGCTRVVCFGDGENDLALFSAADECYAVANACEALKRAATGVIEDNDRDGVARWLSAHVGG